ncbi:hypothetical protein MMH89_03800 [Candidatus Comchoanobacter bicostacola]|uniref:Uncharacterized protein n=1 Tax=Candidatus Comchoanobacter bicostacola TaxID=2919598 RepID=A0ABY5DKJ5_9GAMM|nr:hypothetical protein [Candidatus Comchoanobacter bicostacola]UTC24341.1 hypothetical protein MMH89_03800 [Candidatus Comchoanobacter bicostacola]
MREIYLALLGQELYSDKRTHQSEDDSLLLCDIRSLCSHWGIDLIMAECERPYRAGKELFVSHVESMKPEEKVMLYQLIKGEVDE